MQIVFSFNSRVSYESIFDDNTVELFLSTYKGMQVEHRLKDMIVFREEGRVLTLDQRGSVYIEVETVDNSEEVIIQTLVSNLEEYTNISNADSRYQFPYVFNLSVAKNNEKLVQDILTNKNIKHTSFSHNEIASFTIYQKASLW